MSSYLNGRRADVCSLCRLIGMIESKRVWEVTGLGQGVAK